MISCGCAVFNARVAVAASRHELRVERFPDPSDRDLVARLTIGKPSAPWTPLVRLDRAVDCRRSSRREFFDTHVSEEIVWELTTAASAETPSGPISSRDQRRDVAALVREADAIENADPEYLAELRKWTIERSSRDDGVAASSYPPATGQRGEIPLRDFGSEVSGQMPPMLDSGLDQCLLVIGTGPTIHSAGARRGGPGAAVAGGDAPGPGGQPVLSAGGGAHHQARLRQELGTGIWPQVLLRVGQAAPNVATRRRSLDQVLDEPATQPSTH